MANPEFYNNLILRIYHDNKSNLLALLKRKIDCSVYIAIIDLNNDSTTIINIEGIYTNLLTGLDTKDYSSEPSRTIRNNAYKAYNDLLDDHLREYILISNFKAFEIDFARNQILLVTTHKSYQILDKDRSRQDKKYDHYLVLNFDGSIILSNQIDEEYTLFRDRNSLQFLDHDTLFVFNHNDDEFVLWDLVTKQRTSTKLIDYNIDIPDDEIYYDYVGPYALHRELRLIIFELEDPTYGQDCIKIAKIDENNSLNNILNYSFSEPRLMQMAFNPKGDEFAIIEAAADLKVSDFPTINVRIYSFESGLLLKRIIPINIHYHSDYIKHIHYYSTDIVCVITYHKFYLYNIVTGEELGVIEREPASPYYISINSLFYIKKTKLFYFNPDEREQPVYPIEEEKVTLDEPAPPIVEPAPPRSLYYTTQQPKVKIMIYVRLLLMVLITLWAFCKLAGC